MVITNNFIAELPTVIYMLSLDLSNAWSEFESGISIKYISIKGARTFIQFIPRLVLYMIFRKYFGNRHMTVVETKPISKLNATICLILIIHFFLLPNEKYFESSGIKAVDIDCVKNCGISNNPNT